MVELPEQGNRRDASDTGVRVGDRVFVNPIVGCGACEHCELAEPNLCPGKRILGIHRDGGLAEFCVAPVTHLTPIPPGIAAAEIAMIESAGTANHALRSLGLDGHDHPTIALIGAGGLGSQVLALAVARGMRVFALDTQDQALARARRAGARGTLNSAQHPDPLAALRDLAGGPVDGVVDCVGFPSTVELGLSALKPGRTLSIVGIGSEALQTTAPAHFIRRSLRIAAIYAYTPLDIGEVSQAVAARSVALSDPGNPCVPLDQIHAALALFADKRRAPARVLITMPGAR
ncbi:Alcohol dehydrogenase [Leucobacter sp. 7(1)]|nr:Alcohol dehydrogenase [Leucobacter sp. 7(1)]